MNSALSQIKLAKTFFLARQKSLYLVSLFLLFFAIFDVVIGYALPVLLSEKFSKTQIGLILGFSSVAGALFDLVLSRVIKSTDYRKMFLGTIVGCALYFAILFGAKSLFIYLVAMAIWGLYWNLLTYGLYNFVSANEPPREHAHAWGVLDIFKGVGLVLGPIIASLAIGDVVGPKLFATGFVFLVAVYIFYVLLLKTGKRKEESIPKKYTKVHSLKIFGKVFVQIAPILMLNVILCVYDLSFATIGPLVSESLPNHSLSGGLFMTLYYLPTLIMLWFVGSITGRFGKKKTSFIGFSVGALLTGFMMFFGESLLILFIVFISAMISASAWPALKGAIADYIAETPEREREIELLTNFTGNIGCVLGPVMAGILADKLGNIQALSAIGILCAVLALLAWNLTPKKINLSI